ncbi:MAG: serine hydrolase [Paracoccaceae bacterium]
MTADPPAAPFWTASPRMTRMGDALVEELLDRYAQHGLTRDGFGLVVLRQTGGRPEGYAHRGDWRCYPCSVVKTFHLVHALAQLDAGSLTPHDELDRALRDMILWSSNMATNYVIDLLTGTTGDTLLSATEMAEWRQKRQGLNDFFRALGWREFDGSNINQKLMDDLRYGREAIFAGPENENRNILTPAVSARLMHEIFDGDLPLSAQSRKRAQDTLFRDRSGPHCDDPLFQVKTYGTGLLPEGLPVWSKAGRLGWTGDPRICWHKHDLVRTLGRDGTPIIISLMTQGKAICEDRPSTFPEIGKTIWERAESL